MSIGILKKSVFSRFYSIKVSRLPVFPANFLYSSQGILFQSYTERILSAPLRPTCLCTLLLLLCQTAMCGTFQRPGVSAQCVPGRLNSVKIFAQSSTCERKKILLAKEISERYIAKAIIIPFCHLPNCDFRHRMNNNFKH